MSKQITLLLIFIILFKLDVFSQGDIADEQRIVFANESSVGIYLNSTGYGLGYKHAKRLTGYKKQIFEVDFVGINHPKQKKIENPYADLNAKRFVFGKLNALLDLRIGYGQQKEIFSKFDKGGISIRRNYSFGASLAFLKPVYYDIYYPVSDSTYTLVTEKYNTTNIHDVSDIYGKSTFWNGLDDTKLIPGVYFKYSIGFDFSEQERNLRLLELGVIVDAFWKETPIMATEDNNQVFLSLFLCYRFGSVYSKRNKEIDG